MAEAVIVAKQVMPREDNDFVEVFIKKTSISFFAFRKELSKYMPFWHRSAVKEGNFLFVSLDLEMVSLKAINLLIKAIKTDLESKTDYRHKQITVKTGHNTEQRTFLNVELIFAARINCLMMEKFFLDSNLPFVKRLLNSDFLNMNEEKVIRLIKLWINHKYDQRQKYFPALLEKVRFTNAMSTEVLIEELTCYCNCDCFCLFNKDYLISIIAKRNGLQGVGKIKPNENKNRVEYSTATFAIAN